MSSILKSVSILLILAMVISLAITSPVTVNAEDGAWDGEAVDTGWYGNGSADTFEISTAAEFAGLVDLSNGAVDGFSEQDFAGKTIYLSADIDLNYKGIDPIDGGDTMFLGTFDGNNHTVKNFSVSNGMFAQTGTSAVIKNVKIENVKASANQAAGALVGYNMGSTLTVTNCKIKDSTVSANSYSGGLIGITYTSNSLLTVTGCGLDNVKVSGAYTGGVTGVLYAGIMKVSNWDILGGSISGQYSGGVVGYDYGKGGSEIKHCTINSEISGSNCIGGISGCEYRRTTARTTIEDCVVSGKIKSTSSNCSGIGGIVGKDSSGQSYYPRYVITVTNCVSFADISLNAGYAGGIFGCMILPLI